MDKPDPQVKRRTWAALCAAALAAALSGACARRAEILGVIAPDGGAPDAPALVPPRFSPPALVAPLSDPDAIDEDPTLTADLLELFFMSNRAGTRDLWTSRRASIDAAWAPPARVDALSSAGSDWAPAISLDGLRIWFASDRDSDGRGQLWRASRPGRAAPWSPPVPVAELASPTVDFAPAVDATETLLLFASNRSDAAGRTDFDLYASARGTAGGTWGAPTLLPGTDVGNGVDEYDPFVAQGGLVIFFTSMRTGMGDLYWSARRSIAEPFPPPMPLADLNAESYDSDATLSADLGTMMFSSTRSGNAEIYEAHVVP